MASNYTTNYKLPLWEGGDNFLREEFNEANEKVDAALCAATSVSGSYTSTPDTQIDIDLGFRPKLVLIMGKGQYGVGIAFLMDGITIQVLYENNSSRTYMSQSGSIKITETGFSVGTSILYFNEQEEQTCHYVVVR